MKFTKLIIVAGFIFILVVCRLWFFSYTRPLDAIDTRNARIELFSVSRHFVFETYLQCRVISRGIEIERQTIKRSYDSIFELNLDNIKISDFNTNDQSFVVQISPKESKVVHMNCLSGMIKGYHPKINSDEVSKK